MCNANDDWRDVLLHFGKAEDIAPMGVRQHRIWRSKDDVLVQEWLVPVCFVRGDYAELF